MKESNLSLQSTANNNHVKTGKLPRIDKLIADAKLKQSTFKSNSIIFKFEDDMKKKNSILIKENPFQKFYMKELRKVIVASDVILQILDARDPIGTRISNDVENEILRYHEKRMILVLNKIDLVPKLAVSGWLMTLRRSHPTIAMKCGTKQYSKNSIGHAKGENALKSSSGVGVEGLISLLKNYTRSLNKSTVEVESVNRKKIVNKTCITVGIIGYPNVGKSSLVNTLKRRRSVGISSRPGFTKNIQEVVLDQHIRLIDTPGVVFFHPNDNKSLKFESIIRNHIDLNCLDDPISVIGALLKKCEMESLMMIYSIPSFNNDDVMTFLSLVAKKTGFIRKGGILDKDAAARMIIKDWNNGKVPFYTPPPLLKKTSSLADKDCITGPQILSEFRDCFDTFNISTDDTLNLNIDNELDYVRLKTDF